MSIPRLDVIADGTYHAFWSENRRSKRKSMGTKDRAEAEARFAQWLLIRNTITLEGPKAAFTVAECWAFYTERHRVEAADTQKYSWKALEPHFGRVAVGAVDQDVVDEYVRMRRDAGRKDGTIRREIGALVAALNFCARPASKMLDPAHAFSFETPPPGDPKDRWLTQSEMRQMFDAAARMRRGENLTRGERFLWIALNTGARKQAVFDLTWDRVDFETNVIHLDVPGRKKTTKRRAAVPISKDLRPVLLRAYAERENELVMTNKGEIWATIQSIAIEAGLGGGQRPARQSEKPKATGISPHTLRHTAATHMARRGVPLWIIAKVLGNTLSMVEKVYAKHAPDDLREAVNLISNGLEAAA